MNISSKTTILEPTCDDDCHAYDEKWLQNTNDEVARGSLRRTSDEIFSSVDCVSTYSQYTADIF